MKLYNVLTGAIEEFTSQTAPISLYVCGITPYDTTHLGHAFTYCSFDVLVRYLEYCGKSVRYCQNVTDIDDDIFREAKKSNRDWIELGSEWTAHFMRDMIALNVRPPDIYPRATEVIPEIIEIVSKLVESGMAYESRGSVYFHVDSDPTFGKLSKIPRDRMLSVANERGNLADDPKKRDPLDFVLWQSQAPGEPAWISPWGPGRPGWHIECSAMNMNWFGETIDIHGGGADLVFPHHECEIAQSENFTGKGFFSRFWVHTAMVGYEGEKMSKSLGNLVMVDKLLQRYSPNSLRLYLASHHYRDPWEFTFGELDASVERCLQMAQATKIIGGQGPRLDPQPAKERFEHALELDLNTPLACQILCQFADEIMTACDDGREVTDAQGWLSRAGSVLGLELGTKLVQDRIRVGWERHLARFTYSS